MAKARGYNLNWPWSYVRSQFVFSLIISALHLAYGSVSSQSCLISNIIWHQISCIWSNVNHDGLDGCHLHIDSHMSDLCILIWFYLSWTLLLPSQSLECVFHGKDFFSAQLYTFILKTSDCFLPNISRMWKYLVRKKI